MARNNKIITTQFGDSDDEIENFVFPNLDTGVSRNIINQNKTLPKIPGKAGARNVANKGRKSAAGVPKPSQAQQRDKVLRQAQLFHSKQMKALMPDPQEVQRAELEERRAEKMKSNIRDILDAMMPSIVTEVALKLGGAMYAQENAIKNIVDDYIKVNPVVENRSQKIQQDILVTLKSKLSEMSLKMNEDIPKQVMSTIESECLATLRNDMEKVEQRIDTVRQGLNTQASLQDDNREKMKDLEEKLSSLRTDLEISCSSTRKGADEAAKLYTDQNSEAIREKFKGLKENVKKLEKSCKDLKVMVEGVSGKVDANSEALKGTQGQVTAMSKKCCSIM